MSLEKELHEVKKALQRIETAIAGDEKMGTKGLVHQQKDQGKRIADLETYKTKETIRGAKMVGAAMVLGAAAGAGSHSIWHIISKLWK